jgi:diacylglycerol kinase (ATP)
MCKCMYVMCSIFCRVLCETVKDFAIRISETSLNTGDQQLGDKCEVLQQKLDLLLRTLHTEESFLSDNGEDLSVSTLRSDKLLSTNCPSTDDQEKGLLEKSEKEITNLTRARMKRRFEENQAVISR